MRIRLLACLAAGLLVAFAVTGFPASAMDASIAAVDRTGWNPSTASIQPGESVTWTNGTAFMHNVCVRRSNVSSGCAEYRSGNPSDAWPSGGYTHTFAGDGTFTFICQLHPGMTGTITVGTGANPPTETGTGTGTGTGTNTGTGTGTSTTPPPYSQPTDTTTVPTQTNQAPASDTTAPTFTGKVKRRSSRKALILELGASEDATLKSTVSRRPPRGRTFTKVGQASVQVKQGKNVVTLPRKASGRLRSGAYRVQLQLVDAAGNKSVKKTFSFKLA